MFFHPSACLPANDIQDKANQLVSSKNADGKITKYEYDAAGRMVKEGEKTFAYDWLDKVMQVAENGKTTQSYSYDISGQLASADYGDSKETFLWDGLALLSRNNLKYVNEPAVTGGNPILAGDKMLFDDMLGNTLGVKDGEKFSAIDRDAFGELKPGEKPNLVVNFFTGKPEVDGLGYSFLFRNYRADLGKWQTTDPLGYPDGWNNLAYVNNGVTMNIDWAGGSQVQIEINVMSHLGKDGVIIITGICNDNFDSPAITDITVRPKSPHSSLNLGVIIFEIDVSIAKYSVGTSSVKKIDDKTKEVSVTVNVTADFTLTRKLAGVIENTDTQVGTGSGTLTATVKE